MELFRGGGAVSFLLFDGSWTPSGITTVVGEATVVVPVQLEIAQWSIRQSAVGTDVTTVLHDGTRGGTKGVTVEWTVALPVDLEVLPEENGIRAGEPATVWFRIGDQLLWHKIDHTQITYAGPASDATGDLFRLVIQGAHGRLTHYTAGEPAMPPEDPYPMSLDGEAGGLGWLLTPPGL